MSAASGDGSSGDDAVTKTTPPKLSVKSVSSGVTSAMAGAQGAAQVMSLLKKPFSTSAISLTQSSSAATAPTGRDGEDSTDKSGLFFGAILGYFVTFLYKKRNFGIKMGLFILKFHVS